MPLTLRLKETHQLLPEGDISRTLSEGSLSVGRGTRNDWVLPDPERIISKQHCTIEAEDDTYSLTDTSSNGVFLNGAATPVGRGNTVQLHDGDEICIGHFRIAVTLGEAKPAARDFEALPRREVVFDESLFAEVPEAAPRGDAEPRIVPGLPEDLLPAEERKLEALGSEGEEGGAAVAARPDDVFAPADDRAAALEEEFFRAPEPKGQIPADWDAGIAPAEEPQALPTAPPPPPPPTATPPPPTATPPSALATAAAGTAERQALRAFLGGAGLQDLSIADEAIPETLQLIGAFYRGTVRGLMEVLAARSSIKGEFRLSQTTIQPVENNPLKFSLNVDDAMTALLTKRGRGYLPPLRALDEAFDDIKAHQVAVMVGMQAALMNLLRRFDPAILEQRVDAEGASLGDLLQARNSRYWEAFTREYKDLARAAEDDFQDLFGREFARAYEEQARKLARHGGHGEDDAAWNVKEEGRQ